MSEGLTDDPFHPGINKPGLNGQNEVYLVLSEEERRKGFVRPVRRAYKHTTCGAVTTMSTPLAETYARKPDFYTHTYCVKCGTHLPIDEFVWDNTDEKVGSETFAEKEAAEGKDPK